MNHTRNLLIIAACIVGIFVGAAQAQTLYVGVGPSLHSDLPHGAMNLTIGTPVATDTTLLVNYSARGTIDDFKRNALVYKTSTGIRRVIARATAGESIFELFGLADVGADIAPTATGFAGASGGGVTYKPGRAPNWALTAALQGDYSKVDPLNPGWRKNFYIQFGYNFKTSK
jgi:hypothetical protein